MSIFIIYILIVNKRIYKCKKSQLTMKISKKKWFIPLIHHFEHLLRSYIWQLLEKVVLLDSNFQLLGLLLLVAVLLRMLVQCITPISSHTCILATFLL